MTVIRWKPAFSWLDVKLGMRMMRKYPGVSLAIVFALTIGPGEPPAKSPIASALGQSPPFDEGGESSVVGVGDGRAEPASATTILRDRVRRLRRLALRSRQGQRCPATAGPTGSRCPDDGDGIHAGACAADHGTRAAGGGRSPRRRRDRRRIAGRRRLGGALNVGNCLRCRCRRRSSA